MTEYSFLDLQKIMRGQKHFEIMDFPGVEGFKIAIKILSQKELEECGRACDFVVSKIDGEKEQQQRSTVYTREMERQLLYRAVLNVPQMNNDTGEYVFQRFFPNADAVGEILELHIVELLITAYTRIQEKYSPVQSLKTPEDFHKVIEDIKKNSMPGLSLSTHELMTLLDFLVKNPEILLKGSGTLSQPSKNSSQSTNETQSRVKVKSSKEEVKDQETTEM